MKYCNTPRGETLIFTRRESSRRYFTVYTSVAGRKRENGVVLFWLFTHKISDGKTIRACQTSNNLRNSIFFFQNSRQIYLHFYRGENERNRLHIRTRTASEEDDKHSPGLFIFQFYGAFSSFFLFELLKRHLPSSFAIPDLDRFCAM